MIEGFARFYVNILEPSAQVLAVALVLLLVLYVFNVLRGGAAKGDVLSVFVGGVMKLLLKTIQVIGRGMAAALRSTFRVLRLVFATVRDFLFSRDL